ncbi:hypothetical protein L228DRAFT_249902 [Xylona heveae TC161]|uniref:DUF4048 domain-containing protein n=1 Tax=Xylona heveae (strain CBS 132557 / TC161) TaxID=1328760 RepID=A0A165ABQ3_XYLHT|nr:hypothetical protein L228DRAFT_249902 [Xylona heveae TC161]KZF20222.1 hypothetical protein L228DRAFT_249902 [Xylona heveae TC161]
MADELTRPDAKRVSSSVDPASVKAVLSSVGETSPVMPAPAERIGAPSSEPKSPTPSSPSHKSMNAQQVIPTSVPSRKGNRVSLSFPIQPSPRFGHTRLTQSSSVAISPSTPPAESPEESAVLSPTESANFLTVLAAQERRVLELKEELSRAETELEKFKRQWAVHEASKKRSEIRHFEPMRSLSGSPGRPSLDGQDDHGRQSRELERRRAMFQASRRGQRKVFSPSRHARTLSLLSTDRNPAANSQPESETDDFMYPLSGQRSSEYTVNSQTRDPTRDALIKTGKQMAVDFREGFWTFIEDLRQATVGDEGVNGTSHRGSQQLAPPPHLARRQGSNASLRSHGKSPVRQARDADRSRSRSRARASHDDGHDTTLVDVGGDFWKDNGVYFDRKNSTSPLKNEPTTVPTSDPEAGRKTPPKPDVDDGWDNWDSPSPARKSRRSSFTSTSERETSPPTMASSPRTSTR